MDWLLLPKKSLINFPQSYLGAFPRWLFFIPWFLKTFLSSTGGVVNESEFYFFFCQLLLFFLALPSARCLQGMRERRGKTVYPEINYCPRDKEELVAAGRTGLPREEQAKNIKNFLNFLKTFWSLRMAANVNSEKFTTPGRTLIPLLVATLPSLLQILLTSVKK